MGWRLVTAMRRSDSGKGQFVKRIPNDLRERLIGMRLEFPLGGEIVPITITPKMQSIRFSLRTDDAREVKRRQAEAVAYLEGVCANLLADKPVSLTHRQCVALSGDLYRSWEKDLEPSLHGSISFDDGMPAALDHETLRKLQAGVARQQAERLAHLQGGDREKQLGPLVDKLLLRQGIASVTSETRDMLLGEFGRALSEGLQVRARKAGGDFGSDPTAERFPEWSPPPIPVPTLEQPAAISLRGLVEGWWAEAKAAGRSVSTHESYRAAIEALAAFLGHDDAARVVEADIVRFKDHLISTINPRTGKPLSAKTIKDSYLSGVRNVLGWAVGHKRITSNAAANVRMKAGKKPRLRDSWFNGAERKALLEQASGAVRGRKEPWQRFEARRWVPWLCAYTGARVGEMVQLRKRDVRQVDGHWIIAITPEAITVKGGDGREVPIHPHLVEMGFLEFVAAAPDGFLFMWSGDGRAAWRTVKNQMVKVARQVVPDPNVQPNHGWRHTFKTIGLEAELPERVLDAICGHSMRTEGEKYGGSTVVAKAKAMERFPRYAARAIRSLA